MSDADNQPGDAGDTTAPERGEVGPGAHDPGREPDDPAPADGNRESPDEDEASRESFPASDPPANY